ncbi:unnamed protein product [Prorocentrum cordatum]|uniref:Transmembrane protein n=1 Tax=Prorocentrum cordatum TaxID=2364126 RepID=A0ABN9TEQ4_9DINO|nr:unnamed protein product [Polarella glacialis]
MLVFWAPLLTMVLLRVLPLMITLALSFFRHLTMLLACFLFVSLLQGLYLVKVVLLRALPLLVSFSSSFLLFLTMLLACPLYFNHLLGFSLTSAVLLQILPLLIPPGMRMSLLRGIFRHLTALGGLPLKALRSYFLNVGFMMQTLMAKGVCWVP